MPILYVKVTGIAVEISKPGSDPKTVIKLDVTKGSIPSKPCLRLMENDRVTKQRVLDDTDEFVDSSAILASLGCNLDEPREFSVKDFSDPWLQRLNSFLDSGFNDPKMVEIKNFSDRFKTIEGGNIMKMEPQAE